MKKLCFLSISAFIYFSSFAQNAEDTLRGRFHDDLLDQLVGKWYVTSVAHNFPSTAIINAGWVLNHQYLHMHFKGNEIIPWWHVPMEYQVFIGNNRSNKRYVIHGMSIEGDNDPSEGFLYGYRSGNKFEMVAKMGTDSLLVQQYTFDPSSVTWSIKSRWDIGGKEGEVFLEMKLEAQKP